MCMTNLLVGRAKEKFTHNLLIVKLTIFFPIQFETHDPFTPRPNAVSLSFQF